MTDWVDEIFEKIDNAYIKYMTDTFICDKCKEEKPLYHSVLLPARGSQKIGRFCEQCYWKLYDESEGENNDR